MEGKISKDGKRSKEGRRSKGGRRSTKGKVKGRICIKKGDLRETLMI